MFQTNNQITEMVRISGKKFSTSTKKLEKSSGEVQVRSDDSVIPAACSFFASSITWVAGKDCTACLPATVSSNMAGWEIPPTKMEVLPGFTVKSIKL
jgi:hypothetical protein